MHFVKFHPEVASCLLSEGKRKYAPLGMRLLWKYIRNYFLVFQLISHFLLYLQNYKEYEAEILDLQSEKYGLSFDIKKYTTSGWTLGDENVICLRAFKQNTWLLESENVQNPLVRVYMGIKIGNPRNQPFILVTPKSALSTLIHRIANIFEIM